MKILIDENLPHRLRLEIVGHDVFTVAYMGWSGIENGDLLSIAAAHQFDVLVTNDRGLEYEQNRATLPLAIVVLGVTTNQIEIIRPMLPKLHEVLAALSPCTLVRLDA